LNGLLAQTPGRTIALSDPKVMTSHRHLVGAAVASLMLAVALAGVAHAQDKTKDKDQDKRPQLKLTARPPLGMAPQKVVLTAEIVGGPDDAEDFYCPTVEWDWGDFTQSESTADCAPYEPGKSSIKRRWTVEHVFQRGSYHVVLRLKKRDKAITQATVIVEIRPGLRDL
jgi:hypothetical protein